MHDFKGSRYPKHVTPYAVFSHVRYAVSDGDLEAILAECGVQIDRAALSRWPHQRMTSEILSHWLRETASFPAMIQ